MDPQEFLPAELWFIIIEYLPFSDLVMLRSVGKRLNQLAMIMLGPIEERLKLLPSTRFRMPHLNIIGQRIDSANLLWYSKDKTFTEAVTDEQPRNANRGLCYTTDNKWVWLRGPFKSKSKVVHLHQRFELYLNVFQEDNLALICKHLRSYEVEMLSRYIDSKLFQNSHHKNEKIDNSKGCLVC